MQITQNNESTIYDVCLASSNPPLQVQIAHSAVGKLLSVRDCVAALIFWAQRVPDRGIRKIKVSSHTLSAHDSVLSIEAYRQLDESPEQMLFMLVVARDKWYYHVPVPTQDTAHLENIALTLQSTLSPYLQPFEYAADSGKVLLTERHFAQQ